MIYRLFLLFILLSSQAGARPSLQISQGFEKPSSWRQAHLEQRSDLQILRTRASRATPYDFILATKDLSKALLFKEGLAGQVSGPQMNYFVLEVLGRSFFVVNVGFSESEVTRFIASLKQQSAHWLFSVLLPQSQAMDFCEAQDKNLLAVGDVQNQIQNNELVSRISKCALDAFAGVKNQAQDTMDFFKKLVTDPAALASEMKDSFIQLKNFVTNIRTEMQGLLNSLQGLTLEEKLQLACQLTGETLTVALVGAVSAASLARTLPMIIARIRGLSGSLKTLAELRTRGLNIPDSATKEIISCAR